jgi:hypothetical protein
MDILTFFAQVIESVAWPIATVVILISLREEIHRLLLRTKRIKHNDTEVEFNDEVKAATVEASKSLPELPNSKSHNDKIIKLAMLSPRGAILESWLGVEEVLNNYAKRHGLEQTEKRPFNIQSLIFHELDNQQVGKGVIDMLQRLRKIRNDAVHLRDYDIEPSSAIEFIELADRIKLRIEEA